DDNVPPQDELTVEFVLPRAWLSDPVDEWRLREPGTGRPSSVQLGWRHPVVVRDQARFARGTRDWELGRRWERLSEPPAGMRVTHWVSCRDTPSVEQVSRTLAGSSQALLALAQPPCSASGDLLNAGLDNGIPVMLWRRAPCEDREHRRIAKRCPGAL